MWRPINTFGAISAIPTTVSSSVPGTSYFSSGMRLIGGCCATKNKRGNDGNDDGFFHGISLFA